MPTLPNDVQEAHVLLLAALSAIQPHRIKYNANMDDWELRIAHVRKFRQAICSYLHELGRDCAQHNNDIVAREFHAGIHDTLDDVIGQLEHAAEAARVNEAEAAA